MIFHRLRIRHSHRRHVRKAEKLCSANSEASCPETPDHQLFVLPSKPSLKFPFRGWERRRRVHLNFLLLGKPPIALAARAICRTLSHLPTDRITSLAMLARCDGRLFGRADRRGCVATRPGRFCKSASTPDGCPEYPMVCTSARCSRVRHTSVRARRQDNFFEF